MRHPYRLGALALVAAVAVGACASETTDGASKAANTKAPATTEAPTAPPTTAARKPNYTALDYTVALTVKEKQCFGTAGCNVTVSPKLTAPAKPDQDVEITYEISGDTSGPITATLTLHPDGKYEAMETFMSTTQGVTPTAKVTAVS